MWNEIKNKWKDEKWLKKYLCLVLVAVLVTTQCTQSIGIPLVIAQTSCENHEIHDESCTYAEETMVVQECTHAELCDETCTSRVPMCTHTHDESCSIREVLDEQQCTHSHENEDCNYNEETQTCDHVHDVNCNAVSIEELSVSEGSECVNHQHTEECYDCQHEHDTDCGYLEETVVVAECNHTCESCETSEEADSETESDLETEEELVDEEEVVAEEGESEETVKSCEHSEDVDTCLICNPEEDDLQQVTEEVSTGYTLANTATGEVPINASTFPDNVFRQYVIDYFDTITKDGVLSAKEIEDATIIDLKGEEGKLHECTTLKGIEYLTNLQYLTCSYGKIKSLTLSNENLLSVVCNYNEIESLDISGCTALESLNCYDNNLKTIDISNNKRLQLLGFGGNQVESVKLSENNKSLTHIDAYRNQLTSLDVSGFASLTHLNVASNSNLINLDVSGCTALSTLNVENDTSLKVLNASGIAETDGIEGLSTATGLEKLDLSGSALTGILTFNTQTKLEELNISNCTSVAGLEVTGGALKYLDASGCTLFGSIACSTNPLIKMDLSGTGIGTLNVAGTSLEELYVSDCPALKTLKCIDRPLKKLDASNCPLLELVRCYGNQLEYLDVTNCPALQTLECYGNQLTSLDLTDSVGLLTLNCSDNKLISLDISACTSMTTLECADNELISLELGDVNTITTLNCQRNQLTSLNVANNKSLDILRCHENNITSLDVKDFDALTELQCYENELTELDLSGCIALNYLDCSGNNLTSLKVSGCESLASLYCQYNELTSLELNSEMLNSVNCSYNKLSELNITGVDSLTKDKFEAYGQRLGTLPLYQTNGEWVNDPESATIYRTFDKSNTTFYRDETMQTPLTTEGFAVTTVENANIADGKGVVSATTVVPMVNPVYFKTVLNEEQGLNLSGNFTYSLEYGSESSDPTALAASIGYIDINEAMALEDVNDLIGRFEFSGTHAPAEGEKVTVQCSAFDTKVKEGIPGQYDVTLITEDGQYYCTTKLEVGVKIEYTSGEVDENGATIYDNFPDSNFRTFVLSDTIDTNQKGDDKGFLTVAELNAVTEINIAGKSAQNPNEYASLEGIKYFTKLRNLNCSYCKLEELDVSGLTALTEISCDENYTLKRVDASGCISLKIFNSYYNTVLNQIDFSGCISLEEVRVENNDLTSLELSDSTELTILNCKSNSLEHLDLSKNKKIKTVMAAFNNLETLNVKGLSKLDYLTVNENNLKTLDVSGCISLKTFGCATNQLTMLDISDCTSLETFNASNQKLGTLPMYYDANNKVWVNTAKNSKDIVREFITDETTFSIASIDESGVASPNGDLDQDEFKVNSEGRFTVDSETQSAPEYVYFLSTLANGEELTGSFQYEKTDLVVADGYVDVNDAKELSGPEALLDYLDISINARTTYTIDCPDYSKIKEGTLGQYEVTVTYGGTNSKTSILEVGLDINAQDESGNYLNFPDRVFRTYITDNVDGAEDGFLTSDELLKVTEIIILGDANQKSNCTSLTGVEYFTNLKILKCSYNNLKELDVSQNPMLQELYCAYNELETLILGTQTNLRDFRCGSNNFKSLVLKDLPAVEMIYCSNIKSMTSLEISNCPVLKEIYCNDGTKLADLKISDCPAVELLNAQNNSLVSLDLSVFSELKSSRCDDNPSLISLDISGCTNLEWFYCYNTGLTSLDVSGFQFLENLRCYNTKLQSLNVSGCKSLVKLDCSKAQLTSLDITDCPLTTSFDASGQSLGNLSLYPTGTNSLYVNKAKNSNDKAVVFATTGTSFAKGSVGGDPLSEDDSKNFYVNDAGSLTVNTEVVSNPGTVYFAKTMTDAKNISRELSGTFTYETTTLGVSDGRIDVNEAKKLRGKEDLLDYISAEDLVITEGATYEIICPDFDDINDGIPGNYSVTVKSSADVSRNTVVQVGVKIDYQEDGTYKNFPDEDFRGYVAENIDGDEDGFLTFKELAAVTELNLTGTSIVDHPYEDLTGIEYFTNLKILDCKYGNMVYLDVSKNTKLETFTCAYNELETLILGEQNNLQDLRLGSNKLQRVEIKDFPALHTFYISGASELVSLTVDNCPALKFLNCSQGVKMTELEIIDCPMLETLYCNETAIPRLDVSTFSELKTVRCHYNDQLSELYVSGCTKLEVLLCDRTILTSLDVSNCKELKTLRCYSTNITSLDVSGFTNLNTLSCYSNAQLKSLDVSGCTALTVLQAHRCQLTSLNIEDCPLTTFNAGNQALGTLSMHTDGDFIVNKQKSSEDVVATFMSETTFKSGSTTLNEENVFYVDDKGALTIDPVKVQNPGTITFATPELTVSSYAKLSKAPTVSGSFTYAEAGTITLGNYIERNDAIALGAGNADNLAPYINLSGNETIPTGVTVTVDCEDFDAYVLKGTPGKYDVTVSWPDGTGTVTKTGTVEVVVKIANTDNFDDVDFQNYVARFDTGALDGYLTIKELEDVKEIDVRGTSYEAKGNYDSLKGVGFFTNLEILECSYNKIEELNLSKNSKLEHLSCRGTNIKVLDLRSSKSLEKVFCETSQLEQLYVTGLDKLEVLQCNDSHYEYMGTYNELTSLDLSGCTSLKRLQCFSNPISKLLISDCTALEVLTVPYITTLEKLDLSNNPALKELECFGMDLKELDLSNNPALETLECYDNQLESLDLSHNPALVTVDCYDNPSMTTLNVDNCISLTTLNCYKTALTALDVSECLSLKTLWCYESSITELDLRSNKALTVVYCANSKLTSLQVRGLPLLTELYCNNTWDASTTTRNQLESLDVSDCTSLTTLYCYDGTGTSKSLKSLDVTNCTSLTQLHCYNQYLTSLDLSTNKNLTGLYCFSNRLEELDLSNQSLLTHLECQTNRLSSLDITALPLTHFYGQGQVLGTLSMYADAADSNYLINEAKNSNDIVAEFLTGTNFTQEGNPLTEANGFALSNGVLRITTGTAAKPETDISFTKTLDKNVNASQSLDTTLSGTFNYAVYDVIISDGTIERTVAMALGETAQNELVSCIPIEGSATSVEITSCADFDLIRAGIPGYYDVTVTYTDSASKTISRDTTIELVVDISKEANFADADFRSYVSAYDTDAADTDGAGILDVEELGYVKEMYFNGSSKGAHVYDDLTGIGLFMNLELLDCSYGPTETPMTTLDLSSNTKLKTLDCSNNTSLATLTLGANSNLETLDCSFANLTAGLDIDECPNLKTLKCTNSGLTSLDVTANKRLTTLYCSNNTLTELKLDSYIALEDLSCDSNKLKALDVSKLTNLQSLSCNGNQLTSLNVEGLENLSLVQASGQTVAEALYMTYQDGAWIQTVQPDYEVVRTFQSDKVTDFYKYTTSTGQIGEKLNNFKVNSEGTLMAGTLLPKVDTVYFVSDLISGNGENHNGALNGTFTYDLTYGSLSAKSLIYTAEEIVNQGFESAEDLNMLDGLISVLPDLDEVRSLVVTSMESGFDELLAGITGRYNYTAQLDNMSSGTGYIDVVHEDAVVNAERTAYLYADNIILGISTLKTLEEDDVLTKAEPIYGTYVDTVLTPSNTSGNCTVNATEFAELQEVTAEGKYPLTITYNNDSKLAVKINVRVINDAPASLVKVPAKLELEQEAGADFASAEGYVRLYSDFTQLVTEDIAVYTDKYVELLAGNAANDKLVVDVYTSNNAMYDEDKPLAVLNVDSQTETFRLKSRSLEEIRPNTYKGTMEFTIKYREESDDNAT